MDLHDKMSTFIKTYSKLKFPVTVEDQTSALLCCAEAHALPPWSPNHIIKDTLKHYAERGDIQVYIFI